MQQLRVAERIALAFVSLGVTLTAHGQTITYSNGPGTSAVGSIGPTSDGAFGETFSLNNAAELDSLSFYAIGPVTGNLGNLELVVEAWNDAAVGPALYLSAPVPFATQTEFNGIDATLAAGSYVAFMTTVGVSNPVYDAAFLISPTNGGFVGPMVYVSPGVDPFAPNQTWNTLLGDTPYLTFEATLEPAPVPLPASLWLLASGLAAVGATRRKTRVRQSVVCPIPLEKPMLLAELPLGARGPPAQSSLL